MQTQAYAVNVSLVDEYGAKASGGLQGSLTSNIQFRPDQHAHGFVVFNNLAICQTGPQRLRALLGALSCPGMTVEARADSKVFHISKWNLNRKISFVPCHWDATNAYKSVLKNVAFTGSWKNEDETAKDDSDPLAQAIEGSNLARALDGPVDKETEK
ncbi:hypothetical protein N7519_000563 [Penicillium mononematosum]|uniref:uncharacterized protein n=1 Tax=Penicillium mononematosum TaxID=268346 RepID=UPI0025487025|nr:uncharacterized protein N7519_000563 [Penicillium mononematosum]KAJ6190542.1 hypothetical protein N7519_000563 [Penicillium mononematosum]